MSSSAGNARENRALEHLVAQGWFGICGRASRGPADVLAIKPGHLPMLVQVKGDRGSAFANFKPAERGELIDAALAAGGQAWLCWMPSLHKPAVWIPWTDWPRLRNEVTS